MSILSRRVNREKDSKHTQLSNAIPHLQKLLQELHDCRKTGVERRVVGSREESFGETRRMSTYTPKPGIAHVFENQKKSSEKSPDFSTNEFEIDGKRYQLAVWGPKMARNKKRFLTVQVKPPFSGGGERTRHEDEKANGYQSSSAYVLDDDDEIL